MRNILRDLRVIHRKNFNARNIIAILYFEKICPIKWFFKILRKLIIQMLYNSEIYPENFITVEGLLTLRLPHPFMIIIHRKAKILNNVTIFQGVTIGVVERFTGNDIAPVIGNNVYIGCKASILSNVKYDGLFIADDVNIGAHSLILKSVLQSGTIVGVYK